MASPSGGTFSVDGTPIAGSFDPVNYGAGPHTIGYTYIDANGCPQTTSAATTIVSPPQGPAVVCQTSTTNSVTFGWTPYPGATGYTYYYTVDGGPIQGPFNTTTTDVTIPGLTVNQVVDISVVATGLSPCEESQESTAQCIAQNCILVVDIDATPDFCLDGTQTPLQLTVAVSNSNGTGTGTWSGTCLTGPNNDIFDPSTCAGAGIQNISYTFMEDGCIQTDVIQINVYDAPLAEAGPSIALTCGDPEMELNGAGSTTGPGVQYIWTGPGVILNETTLAPTVNSVGMYTLTVTSAQGCVASDQVQVTQDGDLPVVTAGPNPTLTCEVDRVNLLVAAVPATDISYQWTGPGITPVNDDEASPEVDLPGTYTVIVTNNLNGCSSLPVQVEVLENREIPRVILTNPVDTIDCFESRLTFDLCQSPMGTDNTHFVYEWFFNGIPVSDQCVITVETPGGIYTYVVTDTISGCRLDGQVEARDLIAVPLADAGDDGVIDCRTELVRLEGSNTEVGPDITYQWSGPAGGIVGPDNERGVEVVLPGIYTIEVTNNAIGCVNTSAAEVVADQDAPLADAGPDRELDCDLNPVDLDGTATSGTGALTYEWIDPSGSPIGQGSIVSVAATGTYALAVEDLLNGCVDTAYVEVSLNEEVPQNAVLDIQDPSCFGESDGFINVVDIVGGTPPFNYSFNGEPFSSGTFLNNLGPGIYDLTVLDAAGCEWETSFTIDEPVEVGISIGGPVIDLQLGSDTIIQAQVTLTSDELEGIFWSPSDLVECLDDDCRDVLISQLEQSTTIQATVVDTNQCEASDLIQVRVRKDRQVYIPNVFSPNEDGQNDIFYIFGGDDVQRIELFSIYDRWGEVVFTAENFDPNDPDFGWDGKLRGERMNPGVFVYHATVTFIDGFQIQYKGDVTLIR
ncbi:MAG: gliding motility-associated C-terminal domain-containing protein [Bacteroidota bacterium]